MKKILLFLITIITVSACVLSEEEQLSGTYTGRDNLEIITKNDLVSHFALDTDVGGITLSGYWNIVNSQFTIETFSEGKTIIVVGKFYEDSLVQGDWYIDETSGIWSGEITN